MNDSNSCRLRSAGPLVTRSHGTNAAMWSTAIARTDCSAIFCSVRRRVAGLSNTEVPPQMTSAHLKDPSQTPRTLFFPDLGSFTVWNKAPATMRGVASQLGSITTTTTTHHHCGGSSITITLSTIRRIFPSKYSTN